MGKAKEMKQETVLITGTTSGIGYELSKLFAANGYNLVLVSRSVEKLTAQKADLEKDYGVTVDAIAKDLSDPSAPEEVYSQVQARGIHIDILINNAGFNESGPFCETSLEQELKLIQLHIVSLTQLTKLFLPAMLKNKYGRILNLGSTGSFAPCPMDAVYCASKAYVLNFSNAIQLELKGTGVTVSTLCPGATRTEFAKKAGIENTQLFQRFVMNPDRVAKIAYQNLMRDKKTIIPGLYNKCMVFLIPYTPGFLLNKISLSLFKRVDSFRR